MTNHKQPAVSEVTCKAAAAVASTAIGMIADGAASEAERDEAARLLRMAATMLAPSVPVCRDRSRDGAITVTNGGSTPIEAARATALSLRMAV
jgi:hypothetical protein